MTPFVNYAHRGASEYAPENTMPSFRLGVEMGANGIELDLQKTKDGKIVIFHNDLLDGRCNGTGRIADYTYEELYAMDFGSWKDEKYKGTHIASFEEFAKEFLPMDLTFAIELKEIGIERETLEIINRYKKHDKIYISSFLYDALKNMRALDPDIKLCWLVNEPITGENIAKLKEIDGTQIAPIARKVTEEGIELAKKNGLGVRLWGVGNVEVMRNACRFETEGMTVNFPDKLKAYLDEKAKCSK